MTPNTTFQIWRSSAALVFGLGVLAMPAMADDHPSLNFYGVTGLMDMPSAESQPDGLLSISQAFFGPNSRTTLSFQITPRLSGSFRYTGVRNWNDVVPSIHETYYDRSFDFRFQALDESRFLPAVAVGFQDFAGTGLYSGEYLVATKHLMPNLKVTGGLGWGRLGSYQSIGAPFGPRPALNVGEGGKPNMGQWFKGEMAPFAGVEWQASDKLGFKAEYSSDNYDLEAGTLQTFEHKSPFNFGVEYQPYDSMRLGAYYMYGTEVGVAAHFLINPKERPMGGLADAAPVPVKVRPSQSSDPDAWSAEWVSQPDAGSILRSNIDARLAKDGIIVEALGFTGQTAQIRIRNTRFPAGAQAIGRVARVLTQTMPASVEQFEIVPVVNGMPVSKVTLRRSDIEALEYAPDGAAALRARAVISDPGQAIGGLAYDPDLYPRFTWSVGPYNRIRLFDQFGPFKMDVGLRFDGRYEVAPGLVLSGSVTKKLVGNLDVPPEAISTGLQPVRSDVDIYDAKGDPAIESLTMAWYSHLATDVYGRVSVGYLERMFGGISTEVLWKPVDRRWALGAELNYVMQRDPDQRLGFGVYDYSTASGHLSAYYDIGKGFHAQVDVGRYLAGDIGATLALDREFDNGWKVGGFATLTSASAEEFGSGSFDKGIRLVIPFSWLSGQPTRQSATTTIRPFGRDGGAQLEVDGRLYETVRGYHARGLDAQWGRVWK